MQNNPTMDKQEETQQIVVKSAIVPVGKYCGNIKTGGCVSLGLRLNSAFCSNAEPCIRLKIIEGGNVLKSEVCLNAIVITK